MKTSLLDTRSQARLPDDMLTDLITECQSLIAEASPNLPMFSARGILHDLRRRWDRGSMSESEIGDAEALILTPVLLLIVASRTGAAESVLYEHMKKILTGYLEFQVRWESLARLSKVPVISQ